MPIYEYECGSCGETFELLISRSKAKKSPPCELCDSPDTQRIMSGFCGRSGSSGDSDGPSSVGGACAGCTANSCAGCNV